MQLKNPKHELFAQELANGQNATQAYKNAGFADNRANACRLQQDERIKQRVAQLLANRARKHDKASEKAVQELALSKRWVLERLVENVERGLQARAVTNEDGEAIGEYSYQGGVVNKALELLGKEQGMFIDRKETGKPGDFDTANSESEVLDIVRKELGEAAALAIMAALAKSEDQPALDAGPSPCDTVN